MRKILIFASILSVLSLSVPTDLSFAGTQPKKQTVQGKAKKEGKSIKAKKKGKRTTASYKRPRYASNVNQPQEGDMLKLEGMVKDLNEQ
ncbi:MAG: hypothetical protein WHS43_06220 [Aquificaceae bacterium]|jgi:hypothetical protein|uniref:hypothetical protein n=1 Tax=Hydrogenobacter sp. Uz 6-8 TaxID=3384828 RepID=UPI00309791B4